MILNLRAKLCLRDKNGHTIIEHAFWMHGGVTLARFGVGWYRLQVLKLHLTDLRKILFIVNKNLNLRDEIHSYKGQKIISKNKLSFFFFSGKK